MALTEGDIVVEVLPKEGGGAPKGDASDADDFEGSTTTTTSAAGPHLPWYDSPARLRLLCWCVFGVAFTLLPLVVDLAAGSRGEEGRRPGFHEVLGQGELLIISTVLAIGAIGELILALVLTGGPKGRGQRIFALASISGCIVCFVATLILYMSVKSSDPPMDIGHVTNESLILFGLTCVAGGACMSIAGRS